MAPHFLRQPLEILPIGRYDYVFQPLAEFRESAKHRIEDACYIVPEDLLR